MEHVSTTSPFRREAGRYGLGAHLREQGQKPGVLRQGGRGRDFPYLLYLGVEKTG